MKKFFAFVSLIFFLNIAFAQYQFDYLSPKKYIIGGITISGVENLNLDALLIISGLSVGQEITLPGPAIQKALQRLWSQGFFSDVSINVTRIFEDTIWLNIYLKEQPRLFKVFFHGVTGNQKSDLEEKLELRVGQQVTDNYLKKLEVGIKKYFLEKGYNLCEVSFKVIPDTIYQNTVNLHIFVNKNKKVKINEIIIDGNKELTDGQIIRSFKETKPKNFFRFWKASRFNEEKFASDKEKLIEKYKKLGYRDFRIIMDTVYLVGDRFFNLYIKIYEGKKYYIRNIEFLGVSAYSEEILRNLLDLKPGDVYNELKLQKQIYTNDNSISNLYLNNGYLFFNALVQEYNIENDSIDLRIIIDEGVQARIKKVEITGNTRTNDYVIRRELRVLPGELFSKDDLIRTIRELANTGNFDPEQMNPIPKPNPADNTVDIHLPISEKPNDRFEMSGTYAENYGVMLRFSIVFNNFSLKNLFRPKMWDPLPFGDGEQFSLSVATMGIRQQYYSISYTNPWFGGKKPNSFSTSIFYNTLTNAYTLKTKPTAYFNTLGLSLGYGKRLKFPDDYFIWNAAISYQNYRVKEYRYYLNVGNGIYHFLSLENSLRRSSIDNPFYTRGGSSFEIKLKLTPPYSIITNNRSWKPGSDSLKFKFVELYKLNIKGAWYSQIVKNLVLMASFEYGMLGYYNKQIGYTPFEAFDIGGMYMANYYYMYGVDYVYIRGYKEHAIADASVNPANLYAKYTVELRYPIILKEMASVYIYGFLDAGNGWSTKERFNPFDVKRSAGIGARLLIPMLGLVELNYGYGFDKVYGIKDAGGWHFGITMGGSILQY